MNYYKAREQAAAPFLVFDLVAESIEELEGLGLDTDPLVLPEDGLPSYEGSVCHLRISNGVLVDRQQSQIDLTMQKTTEDKTIALNVQKKALVDAGSFVFHDITFPMDVTSQLRYLAIFEAAPMDRQIQTKSAVVTLPAADIDGFKAAYYEAVITKTEPT